MRPTKIERFLFRGSAVGIGGFLWDPPDTKIPAQASISLPIVGGIGESRSGGFSIAGDEFEISIDSADSTVEGRFSPSDNKSVTTVHTRVRGFRILVRDPLTATHHEVTAREIELEMESTHHLNPGDKTHIKIQPSTDFQDLRIDGDPLRVTFARQLVSKDTFDNLKTAYQQDRNFRNAHKHLFRIPPSHSPFPGDHGIVICSMVTGVAGLPSGATLSPDTAGKVEINNFGSLYLGEIVISEYDRRVAMMRFELGSPTKGDIVIGGGGSDGSGWPP